jgi:predicted transcriptional regulator
MRHIASIFMPRGRGIRKVLGGLEAEVMEIIWTRGEVSVRDVYEVLRRRREIAYTTVMTTMGRLAKKRLLTQIKSGLAYQYRPAVTREAFKESVVGEVIDGLLDGFGDSVMVHLADRISGEDPARMEALAKAIRDRRERK